MGLMRVFKHRWYDEGSVQRVLGHEALARLEQRVAQSEREHTGEIRICVEGGMPLSYLWRDAPPRERALALFGKLGVWDTEHNNGVLIYLLLAERAIEIVADRGVARLVPPAHWAAIAQQMQAPFRASRFEEGLIAAVESVHQLLVQHFLAATDSANPNEFPNKPLLL